MQIAVATRGILRSGGADAGDAQGKEPPGKRLRAGRQRFSIAGFLSNAHACGVFSAPP